MFSKNARAAHVHQQTHTEGQTHAHFVKLVYAPVDDSNCDKIRPYYQCKTFQRHEVKSQCQKQSQKHVPVFGWFKCILIKVTACTYIFVNFFSWIQCSMPPPDYLLQIALTIISIPDGYGLRRQLAHWQYVQRYQPDPGQFWR